MLIPVTTGSAISTETKTTMRPGTPFLFSRANHFGNTPSLAPDHMERAVAMMLAFMVVIMASSAPPIIRNQKAGAGINVLATSPTAAPGFVW